MLSFKVNKLIKRLFFGMGGLNKKNVKAYDEFYSRECLQTI